MGLKALVAKLWAAKVARQLKRWDRDAIAIQLGIMRRLVKQAGNTAFGKDFGFTDIVNYEQFKQNIPVQDYEQLKPYIERIKQGESNVLWPGKPIYFAKTSGTTSGAKYIPISKDSIPNHINTARNALLMLIHTTKNADFVEKGMIFLSGSPEMEMVGGILTGRLSGIVNHHVPQYLRSNQKPTYATNCIDDWEEKLDKIVEETVHADMALVSGIPPWVQMYFDRIADKTGKKVGEHFANLQVFAYGGVNYEPYRAKIEQSLGRKIYGMETYPASEGFIAFQDNTFEPGLLLNVDSGIFFEFIPTETYFDEKPVRLHLGEIELNKNYALVLNTNAGLWGYSIGDTVKFISKNPYKLVVTGRIKHFISAFGEHVIGEEVEYAMQTVAAKHGAEITEFHVAPQVNPPEGGLPYHQWLVEFAQAPADMMQFAIELDEVMQQKNTYYKDLLDGNILQTLKIQVLNKDSFIDYMRSKGKLGGQNKVPRLANDRQLADDLLK